MDNKSISHTRWKCQYHIVFIPKYRKKVLYGREDVREILNTLCKYKNVEIIQEVPLYSGPVKMLVTSPFGASSNIALWRAYSKPPVELVVADFNAQSDPGAITISK